MATGKDFLDTHEKLQRLMLRAGGILEWAKEHNCKFGIKKFQLLDATQKTVKDTATGHWVSILRPDLVLGGQTIKSQSSAKFLDVIVYNKLN
ncbi:hypothetical protein CVT25_008497 [Psilocybe cyanescens]|uniref:Uncharacterized protein n=1 Tax=Psilocybe cyanescens TaxID=93625 RepID=A0A409XRY5_PSICY|nr:hypothetical protein CVT25_008497 [Psilocybe cyanescens]